MKAVTKSFFHGRGEAQQPPGLKECEYSVIITVGFLYPTFLQCPLRADQLDWEEYESFDDYLASGVFVYISAKLYFSH